MSKFFSAIFGMFIIGCTEQTEINANENNLPNIEEIYDSTNYVETNWLDSIRYELHLNNDRFSHLDSVRVYLDIINFSKTQKILVDTFYREFGLKVLDKNNNSPVVSYWELYRSTLFERPEEIQARKIAIKPQDKIQVSYWLTKKLDFELRNKVVPKGEYTMYYEYYYQIAIDSSYVHDSTSSVKFYLERNCEEMKN